MKLQDDDNRDGGRTLRRNAREASAMGGALRTPGLCRRGEGAHCAPQARAGGERAAHCAPQARAGGTHELQLGGDLGGGR